MVRIVLIAVRNSDNFIALFKKVFICLLATERSLNHVYHPALRPFYF